MSANAERGDPNNVARWKAQAATDLAELLVCSPPMEYQTSYNRVDPVMDESWEAQQKRQSTEPTAAQIATVKKSDAYRSVCALIETACQQQGSPGGYQSLQRAMEFFESSGMIYRLRVAAMQGGGKKVSLDKVPAIFPSWIQLWRTPRFKWESRGEGQNSVEACDRDKLVQCATQFYRSGVRCQWFEKSLLEALVSAEFYATIKHAKTNPSAWTGRAGFWVTMLCGWAYGKTRGEDPNYTFLVWGGRILLSIGKLAIVLALAWQALGAWGRDHSWGNLIWLVILGCVLAGMVGRYLAQVIIGWARPHDTPGGALLQGTHFGRALTGLAEVYRVVTVPSMSTSLARETVLKSYELGGGLDQIIVPYLDRALAAGEYEWNLNEPYVETEV